MTKSELIHIRLEPDIKSDAEEIIKGLGLNMSYAVSMFLKQVILHKGIPFSINLKLTRAEEITQLASIIEATGGNGSVSSKNQRILELFANGDIDYETAVFAIKRSFAQ